MSEPVVGVRRTDGTQPHQAKPGDYGRDDHGWWVHPPAHPFGGYVTKHTVTEHPDGTITVEPSILIHPTAKKGDQGWHGWLRAGVWSSA